MKRMLAGFGLLCLAAPMQPATADGPGMRYSAPASVQSWYGSFIGLQAGYGWGNEPVTFSNATGVYGPALGTSIPLSLADEPRGFIGGGQWGTNWQSGRFVYGFLSDFSYSDVRESETLTLGSRTNYAEQRMKWFGTSRVRAGYLLQDNFLVYGSAGLASATIETTVFNNTVGASCAVGGACPNGSESKTRYGWAVGGGAEYRFGPWSLTLDYTHFDLSRQTFSYTDGISPATITASTDFSGDTIRGGLNYRFNWTFFDLLTGGK